MNYEDMNMNDEEMERYLIELKNMAKDLIDLKCAKELMRCLRDVLNDVLKGVPRAEELKPGIYLKLISEIEKEIAKISGNIEVKNG